MIFKKTTLFGVLVLLALSGVGTATASAAECKKEATKKFILCLGEPLTLTEGTLTLVIKTDPGTEYIFSSASGIKLLAKEILEAPAALTSLVSSGFSIQGIIWHFVNVTIDNDAHCKVQNELIKSELLVGRIEGNEKEKILIQPATGEIYWTVKLEGDGTGTCLTAGSFRLTLSSGKGGILCTAPLEVTRLEQLLTCKSSELKFGEEATEIAGSFIAKVLKAKSAEAAQWAIIEGK